MTLMPSHPASPSAIPATTAAASASLHQATPVTLRTSRSRTRRSVVVGLLSGALLALVAIVPATATSAAGHLGAPGSPAPRVKVDVAGCGSSLQSAIDAAATGSVLDLTGCTYGAGALITRPLTLIGATVRPPAGTRALIVKASDVTLKRVIIEGPQASTYRSTEVGILAVGPLSDLVIRDSVVRRFGNAGIWVGEVTNPRVLRNRVVGAVYAGIMVTSAKGGRIGGNVVRRIGINGAAANSGNAYGIAISNEGGAPSTDVVVHGNTVRRVPTWHGLDTHAGIRISFTGNTVSGSPRALFVTPDSQDRVPIDIVVSGNTFISMPSSTPNRIAVTAYRASGISVTGNLATGWGSGRFFEDYRGLSTRILLSGNTIR